MGQPVSAGSALCPLISPLLDPQFSQLLGSWDPSRGSPATLCHPGSHYRVPLSPHHPSTSLVSFFRPGRREAKFLAWLCVHEWGMPGPGGIAGPWGPSEVCSGLTRKPTLTSC